MSPEDTIQYAKMRYADGVSVRDIAQELSIPYTTLRYRLVRSGFVFNTEETRKRIAEKAVGRPSHAKGRVRSREEIQRQIKSRKANGKPPRSGYKHTKETLAKISAATKGKNVRWTPEQKRSLEAIRQACKRFVRRVLKATGKRKDIKSQCILGYTPDELRQHLGEKPTSDVHIDHYVPIAEFFRRGITSPAVINALPNLRWLNAHANRTKSDAVPGDADEVIAKCLHIASKHHGAPPRGQVLSAHFTPGGVSYTKGVG